MVPSLFVAHGSPMVALEDTEYALFLERLGGMIPRPDAIVVFSAHWESDVQKVSAVRHYSTIYDFDGFPDELYKVEYPAKGDMRLAQEIQRLLQEQGIATQADTARGLDHGVWTILSRMYPPADIPVVAMSVNPNITPQEQYHIGEALAPLREKGVLIIGSGVTVHNFQLFAVRDRPEVKAVVLGFENWLEEQLRRWDLSMLFDYQTQAPHANLAVPPNGREHFVPLFYAMGAAREVPTYQTLYRGLELDVLTDSVYRFG